MNALMNFAKSTIGQKIIAAVTGLGLTTFVIIHLIGNFTILMGPEAFNGYAYFLEHLAHGWFIILAELGLIAFFATHAATGIRVYLGKRRARTQGYVVQGDAGGPSKKSLASRSMIITGPLLLLFVILHVLHFKFGPDMSDSARYIFEYKGMDIRNLWLLVVEEFQKPVIVFLYVAAMIGLGFHLVHGVWSGLQSLGATNKRYISTAVTVSLVLGLALAIGFIYIPVHTMLFIDPSPTIDSFMTTPGGLQ